MRVLVVAYNTFRESMRDKVLYVLLFFAAAAILGSKALGWISIGQDIKIVKDVTLASISIFGALVSIFVGTSLLYKEIDKRTLYTILSQPMRRWEFVVGKYLGLMALLAFVVGAMTALSALYIYLLGGTLDGLYFLAALLTLAKLMLVTAFAVFFSAVASPILGAVIVFSIYVFGHATGVFIDLPPQCDGTMVKTLFEWLYYIFPNLANFDITIEASNGVPVSPVYVAQVLVYGVLYSAVVLLLATVAFDSKDL
jgi:ABC-type transport system involved in multi-copper enzyme maturation permease subunit